MIDYEMRKARIGNKEIDELVDKDGVRWYPFNKFNRAILCKYDVAYRFRDTTVRNYMKVIEYPGNPKIPELYLKTWFINEYGIKYVLKKMDLDKSKNKDDDLFRARERAMYEACLYFNVNLKDKAKPMYVYVQPNFQGYSVWELLCIEFDYTIYDDQEWKKCSKCDLYFPNNAKYFGSPYKKNYQCLKCQGRKFKCDNKKIQFIYQNGGLELLKRYHQYDDEEAIGKEFKKFLDREFSE